MSRTTTHWAMGGALVAGALLLVAAVPADATPAPAPAPYVIGWPTSSTADTYTFSGNPTTATFALTGNGTFHPQGDFTGWGGSMSDWNGGNGAEGAFTPTEVYGTDNYGMGAGWQSNPLQENTCPNLPADGSIVPGTVYLCDTAQITFTFSQAVTNPLLNVADLAGGGGSASLWSDFDLVEPGTIEVLSHKGNFAAHSDGRGFGTIEDPGTGFTPGSGMQATTILPNDAHPNMYGAGYGAIKLVGTFTTITFNVTLRYVNFDSSQVTSPINYNDNDPEWVEFVPVLDTTPPAPALPDTGAKQTVSPWVPAGIGVLGAGVIALAMMLRRRTREAKHRA